MTHDIDLGEGGGENKVAPKNLIWMSNTHAILFSNAKYTNEINTVCLTLMVGMFTMPHAPCQDWCRFGAKGVQSTRSDGLR